MSLLIISAIAVMLLLSLGVIFFVMLYQRRIIAHQQELKLINQQKELELIQASIQSEEVERMRIASELHDDIAATLASARLFLYKEKDAEYNEAIINQSKELLDEGIVKIRNISHKLQPAILQHLGLQQALESLTDVMNRSGHITASHTAVTPLPRIPDSTELAIYRIAQELLTNMLKHAQPTAITLHTQATHQHIQVVLAHNGTGLTQDTYEEQIYKKGATGLKNIVNRIKSINASIRFYQDTDGRFKIELTVPVQKL